MKVFYYVLTNSGIWGRGTTLDSAIHAARISKKTKGLKYVVCTGTVKEEATEDELKNIMNCFVVCDDGSITTYDKPSSEDSKMLDDLFIGWLPRQMVTNK